MVRIEEDFVLGVLRKTVLLGVILAGIACLAASLSFGMALAIGMLVAVINVRFVTWVMKKMFEQGEEGISSPVFWTTLLTMKMLILMGLIWFLVASLGIDAVAFAVGFSLFLPAIGWQTATMPLEDEPEEP